MHSLDKKILKHLLDRAIAAGAFVTVHDGEGFCLTYSQDTEKIISVLGSTETDGLYFTKTGKAPVSFGDNRLGIIWLVHGNEPGVIVSDYSDNDFINGLFEGVPEE